MLERKKLKNLKSSLAKLPRKMAENSLLTIFCLIFLALILAGIVFYQFFLSIKVSPELFQPEKLLQFDEKKYQRVLAEWQKQNQKNLEIEAKKYSNPFK